MDGEHGFLFWLFVPTHLFPLLFLGDSRGQPPKKKKFDWFSCDFDAWVSHSPFFFFYFWEGLFFFNVPAWDILLSSAVGLREIWARSLMKQKK